MKMKKSRFSNTNIRPRPPRNHHESPHHPGKPPHLITPTLNKQAKCNPNYMKSTSSFEARKEKTAKVISSISSTQKLAKTLTKSASFKKATRNFKRIPSLKLKQNTKTCSSTQKDKKFPPYLELKPGATEAKGKSVQRVCSYSYCSLNGDHHNSARTPLKKFMYSRQKELKTDMVDHNNNEFFVDIFVPNRVVDQVSESLSDGPCSEIDLQDNQIQFQDTKLSDLKNFSLEDVNYKPSSSVQSLDEFYSDKSDLVLEEGQIFTRNDMNENEQVCIQNDYSNDSDDKPGFEYSPYFHDEIVEYLSYSDAASLTDSESTQTGEKDVEVPNMIKEKVEMECRSNDEDEVAKEESTLEDEAKVYVIKLEEESTDKQDEILSEIIEEISETDSNESDEDKNIIREQNSFDIQQLSDKLGTLCTKEAICIASNDDGTNHNEDKDSNGESESNQELHNSCNKVVMRCRKADEDDEEDKEFNPRGPNFLEIEPDPEAEKVDLRHQEMDERRNAEEWMLDHALRKTVNQLSPARKKKVALLVEAYETVLPVSKNESEITRDSLGYD